MQNKDKVIAAFAVLLVVLLSYVWLSPGGLKLAPSLRLNIIDGQKISLDKLRGQPVLITFWATSCPGCLKEMPHLIELYHELHPKGFELIGVAMPYDRPDHVLEMAKRKKIPYPIAIDVQGEAVRAFGNVQLTPSSFLIAPNGQIVKHKIGEMNMAALRQQILTMLAATIQTKG